MIQPTTIRVLPFLWTFLTFSCDSAPEEAICTAPAALAEDSCPGQTTLELEVVSLAAGTPVVDVLGTEVGNTTNTGTSGPNGRLILCVEDGGDRVVELTGAGLLPTQALFAQHTYGTGLPTVQVVVSNTTDADTLAAGAGTTRDSLATLFVSDLTTCSGAPASGATVRATGAEGPFVRAATGSGIAPTDLVTDQSALIHFNAPGQNLALDVAPATNTRCAGPTAVPAQPGGITFAAYRCGPS